jgi:PAS domain S-box-containing protein
MSSLLASIAGRFVHAADDELHVATAQSMGELCDRLGADFGAALFVAGDRIDWCESCTWSQRPDQKFIAHDKMPPAGIIDWLRRQVAASRAIVLPTASPPSSEDLAGLEWLRSFGAASHLCVRLAHGSENLGVLLLAREAGNGQWNRQEIDTTTAIADLFSTTHERRKLHLQMSRRLQFESLVGEIASSLLRTPSNLLDKGIDDALCRLAEYLAAERVVVILLSSDGNRFGVYHEYCDPARTAVRETLQDLPLADFVGPGNLQAIFGKNASIVSDRQSIPESASQLRTLLDVFGIESTLAVPLILGSEVVGAIAAGRTTTSAGWSTQEIALLRACADIIITTIQRLRIEQALRESDEKFSRTFLAMPDAVAISDFESGVIVDANPAFETTTGFALQDVLGKPALSTGVWNDPEDRARLVRDVMRSGVVRNREAVMCHANGRLMDALLSAVRIELHGRPYLCIVMRDVTESKAADAALRAAESALRELNLDLEERVRSRTAELETSLRELESFSYSVSHDLRSPLRGINGFASLLAEDYGDRLDDTAREYLVRIATATVRMGDLIDELLDLARISRVPMRKSRIDVAAMAKVILAELAEIEPGRNVFVAIADIPPASADRGLMQIAISNLVGNAWKFTGHTTESRIEVGCRDVDGEQQYFVKDNGAGFDMDNYPLLFRPFSRLHRPSEYPGTGIGLATVARIIQRHGGRIWAEGAIGCGATFYFTLG